MKSTDVAEEDSGIFLVSFLLMRD